MAVASSFSPRFPNQRRNKVFYSRAGSPTVIEKMALSLAGEIRTDIVGLDILCDGQLYATVDGGVFRLVTPPVRMDFSAD